MSFKHDGFILFDQLVYIAILILITALTITFSLQIRARSASMCANAHAVAQLFSAQDRLLWDLYTAPVKISQWLKIYPHEISFLNEQRMTISWFIKSDKVIRAERHYKKNKQMVSSASVVATGIQSLAFDVAQTNNEIVSVTFTIMPKKLPSISQKIIYERNLG